MDNWDDDSWPMSIQKKDEEQKMFHKSVSSAFFLMLDGNDLALPLDTIRELCRLPDTHDALPEPPKPERVMHNVFDEDYGPMLDVIEGLKLGLVFENDHEDGESDATEQRILEFTESLTSHEEDFEVPLFRLTERRSTKPS